MKIELHILQNFAPANLNRSDTGSPKDCEFGGIRRARISSQCFKSAMRKAFEKTELSLPNLAIRSKRLHEFLIERFTEFAEDGDLVDIDFAAEAILTLNGISLVEEKVENESDDDGSS